MLALLVTDATHERCADIVCWLDAQFSPNFPLVPGPRRAFLADPGKT
jgi:hypothetical protein